MSQAHYERLYSLLELYQKLGEAEALDALGEQGVTHAEAIQRLKANIT